MKEDQQQDEIIQNYLRERQRAQQKEQESIPDDLTAKKQYLRIHVLEVYSKQEDKLQDFADFFLLYLKKHKRIQTDSHDLNMLTLQELKALIRQFSQSTQENKIVQKVQPPNLQAALQNEDIKHQMNKQEFQATKVYYSNGAWDYQLNGYQECRTSKIYFKIDQGINPTVKLAKHYTKKSGGFFGIGAKLELWVTVSNNFASQTVQRKIQDFMFLAQIISKNFPRTFVTPLQITQKQLDRVQQQSIQISLLQRCKIFINAVVRNQQFLQNIFTNRFFRESKYQQFTALKVKSQKLLVNNLGAIEDIKGLVGIEISDKNQQIKKDYSKKSELLQKMWKSIAESNNSIILKLKEIDSQIEKQKRQFDFIIKQITQNSYSLSSYEEILRAVLAFRDMFNIYSQNFSHYQLIFGNFNSQIAVDAHRNWRAFSKYKNQIGEISHEYQLRRKVFLDSQAKKLNEKTAGIQKQATQKQQEKQVNNLNQSIISEYGIEQNPERESLWIQRCSKWQAYINSQFINSFQKLLNSNTVALNQVLRQNAHQILQSRQKQEQSVINNLSAIL